MEQLLECLERLLEEHDHPTVSGVEDDAQVLVPVEHPAHVELQEELAEVLLHRLERLSRTQQPEPALVEEVGLHPPVVVDVPPDREQRVELLTDEVAAVLPAVQRLVHEQLRDLLQVEEPGRHLERLDEYREYVVVVTQAVAQGRPTTSAEEVAGLPEEPVRAPRAVQERVQLVELLEHVRRPDVTGERVVRDVVAQVPCPTRRFRVRPEPLPPARVGR